MKTDLPIPMGNYLNICRLKRHLKSMILVGKGGIYFYFCLKTVQIYFILKTGLQGILSDDSRRTERIISIVKYVLYCLVIIFAPNLHIVARIKLIVTFRSILCFRQSA